MAGRTFAVNRERRFLAGRVKMVAEIAFNPGPDDLADLPFYGQVQFVREVEQYCARLIVIGKGAHFGHLVGHDLRVTYAAKHGVLGLGVEPLLVTRCAGFVARPGHRRILLTRLMAIRAFSPGLQMLTVTEGRRGLSRSLGSGRASDQPGRKVGQRSHHKRGHKDDLELRVSCHVHFQRP